MVFLGLCDVRKRLPRKETFSYDFSAAVESWCIFKWKWIETIGRFVSWGEAGGDTELWIDWFANAAGSKRLFPFFYHPYLSIINTNADAEYDDNNCGRNHCQLELLFKCTLISIDLFCALGWKSIVGLQTFVRKQTRKRSWNYIVSENDSVMSRTHLYNKVLVTTPNIQYLNI